MATRFYLPQTGAAAVSPTFGGGTVWGWTTGADRIKCVTTKISSALTNKTLGEPGAGTFNQLSRQYVSDPIGAQTITGTIKGRLRASTAAAAADHMAQILVYVVSNDGATVRGQLIAFNNGALTSEFVLTTLTNRQFPRAGTVTVTSQTASANDRIVIEIGARTIVGDEGLCTLNFGDNAASDLAEDETDTGADNPWIEFSQDLFTAATVLPPATTIQRHALTHSFSW